MNIKKRPIPPKKIEEIKLLLFFMTKFLKHDLERRLKKARVRIGVLGFAILHLISQREQTVRSLSRQLILTPATLVPAVANLNKQGLISRQTDKNDRRSYRLRLTPKGLKFLADLPAALYQDPLIRELKLLSPIDQKKLYELLNKLSAAIIGANKLKNILNLCLLNH